MTTPRVIRRLDELERDVAPARDLWPAIASQIEARPRRPVSAWLPWAVAAGLAFVTTGLWWAQRSGGSADRELAALGDPALEAERRRLAAEVPGLLDALPLEARFGATQSLDAVRSARSQIVAALRRDGNDPELREWLRDNQEQEVSVLRTLVEAGAQTRAL